MPMDGFTIGAMVRELNNTLQNCRIDKVNQPECDELILFCRNNGENYRLLISSSAGYARLGLTEISKQNPEKPSSFCMLLRKHLVSAHIKKFEQITNERIVKIHIDGLNDFNEHEDKYIYVEIMGKYSNVIFCDKNGKIIDCARHVNSLMSRARILQPGLQYTYPPSQGKINPYEEITDTPCVARAVSDKFLGVSRVAAEEIIALSNGDFVNGFKNYIKKFDFPDPVVLFDENGVAIDFFAFEQTRFLPEFQKHFSMLSEAMENCIAEKEKFLRIREKTHSIKNVLDNALAKCTKNRARQQEKLIECADMEKYRIWGELVTANLYMISRGDKSVTVNNYYTNEPETILLDNTISPQANAQRFFKKYNKLKTAKKLLNEQIAQNEAELDFINEQLEAIEKCENTDDIIQLKLCLSKHGLIRQNDKKQKTQKSNYMQFRSSSGITVLAGKNNIQNDELTFTVASANEYWLHAKDIHGSHVIIKSEAPDNATLEEAALIAAYYSKARGKGTVSVDCTKRRFVKKISGADLGKVKYTNQVTYFIPDADLRQKSIERIK